MKDIYSEIDGLGQLPHDWHYGRGKPSTVTAIAHAKQCVKLLLDRRLGPIETFPTEEGGVLVSAYSDQTELDIRCEPDGLFELVHDLGGEFVEKTGVKFEKIKAYIERRSWLVRNSPDSSIQGISVRNLGDLKVKRSETQVTEQAYHLLSSLALNLQVRLFANTSNIITMSGYRAAPRFSGGLIAGTSPKHGALNGTNRLEITAITTQ